MFPSLSCDQYVFSSSSPDQGRVQAPGKQLIKELLSDMKAWEDMCNKEAEKFVGGHLLSCQDQLYHLYKRVEAWTDDAHKVRLGTPRYLWVLLGTLRHIWVHLSALGYS
jgi:hypothetical protein